MKLYPENLLSKLGFDEVLEQAATCCETSMGRQMVLRCKPKTTRQHVQEDLTRVKEMMDLLARESSIPVEPLEEVQQDIAHARIHDAMLQPEGLLRLVRLAVMARRLKQFHRQRNDRFPELDRAAVDLIPLKDLEKQIYTVLTERGSVRDDASPHLQHIRRNLESRKQSVRSKAAEVIRRISGQGMLAEQEPTLRNGRMVLPLKAEYKRRVSGFVHDVSATGQTVYLEPVEVLNINNEIRELENQEQHEVQRLLEELTFVVGQQADELEQNRHTVALFDRIQAAARFAGRLEASVPVLSDTSDIALYDAYNPMLLLKRRKSGGPEKVVPLTLELSQEERGLLITGPNAGGKSVALKTLGLNQVLLQSGFPIPAGDHSRLPVLTSLFVDMGDEQSIENDLSTFSSRLAWMKQTLDGVSTESMVLVDEAGSGTDPEEGTALFQAFFEQLQQQGARVLATTHHGALKVFADQTRGWVNGSMEFDQEHLTPTYRFNKGVPGSSYAFEIARRLGLQEALIEKARELVGSAKDRMESLILELEKRNQQVSEMERAYQQDHNRLEQKLQEYEERLEKLKKERDSYREQALQEAREIVDQANRKIEQTVQQVREGQAGKEAVKNARQQISDYSRALEEQHDQLREKKQKTTDDPPQPGDAVVMRDSNSTGRLIRIDGNNAVVKVNGLTLKTRVNNLLKVAEEKKSGNKGRVGHRAGSSWTVSGGTAGGVTPPRVSPRLDLRGMRAEEAENELVRYMDSAVRAGLGQVDIVHGKGNGILRAKVHEYLKTRSEVASFDLAPHDQGGYGCTVVELK